MENSRLSRNSFSNFHLSSLHYYLAIIWLLSVVLLTDAAKVHKKHGHHSYSGRGLLNINIQTNNPRQNFSSSNLCDPNVKQYSGYIQTSDGANIFFWFFESRNSPYSSPLTLYLNGGPGCSSMIGLFQEVGPCRSQSNGNSTYTNPYSWNQVSNLLFVDQPIGAGFSYGANYLKSTDQAASNLYEFLQKWFTIFTEYSTLNFHIFGESYAGRYIPTLANLIVNKTSILNIACGLLPCQININLKSIGIGNGWIDPAIQYASLMDYARNNSYNPTLVSSDVLTNMNGAYPTCKNLLSQCDSTSTNQDCSNADDHCFDKFFLPFAENLNCSIYDVRASLYDKLEPPEDYINYLNLSAVMKAIGANTNYVECSEDAYMSFTNTADLQVARSSLTLLSNAINGGIRTLLYFGDADANCNWIGGLNVAKSIPSKYQSQFNSKTLQSFKVNGQTAGQVQSSPYLSFVKILQAGHEAPYYQPQNSLGMFTQWINGLI
ncbi:5536_t:CDS:2 [Cetraspora pellucida]|uniref:5536_t:CDS:1 n=1 Tax=Cetraspora pellucida TaxID=1433469 RepID=A0ACA9KX83_9GLOM|nr:5536_t:CDS:2 [Cetraspora pellucida]